MLRPIVLCMGASTECAAFLLDCYELGYNSIAVGLDTDACLNEIKRDPSYALVRNKIIFVDLSLARVRELLLNDTQSPNQRQINFKSYVKELLNAQLQALDLTVDGDRDSFGLGVDQHLCAILNCDIKDFAAITAIARFFNVQAILPTPIGYLIKYVGCLNDICELPGISEHSALNFTDKLRVHQLQSKHQCHTYDYINLTEAQILGIESSQSGSINFTKQVEEFLNSHPFPLMLKPRFGSGSRFASVVSDRKTLYHALMEIQKHVQHKLDPNSRDHFCYDMLLEEFLGQDMELSCNGIVHNGKVIAMILLNKIRMSKLPYRQDIAYNTALLPKELRNLVHKELEKNLNALGVDNSVFLADVIVQQPKIKPKAYVVDIAGRHTGYFIFRIFKSLGCNLMQYFYQFIVHGNNINSLQQPLQESIDQKLSEHNCIQHFFDLPAGTITKVPSKEDIVALCAQHLGISNEQAADHILYYKCTLKIGDVVAQDHSKDGGLTNDGFVLLKDIEQEQALEICDHILQAFEVQQ